MKNELEVRPLSSNEEYIAFESLQRETWGQDLAEVVSGSLARIVQKIGGMAAGAFDERNRIVGFVFGFTGYTGGRPVHWSHMLAVRKGLRDCGNGKMLKFYQRDILLSAGIQEVYWTYDPLVAKNAHFNFNSLGAEATEYVPDMYGPGDDSELFRGLGTDRFIVVWRISSDRVNAALAREHSFDASPFSEAPIVVFRKDQTDNASPPSEVHFGRDQKVRIEVPPDIHALRARSAHGAAQWRKMTREAFQFYFKNGYSVVSFHNDRTSGRCHYCLERRG